MINATTCLAGDTEEPAARLNHSSVAAQGKQSALLTVSAFARYAVTVTSSQGVAIQAVDRMAGAGPITGEAGKQDGRLDLFLDRGEHKIVTYAAAKGNGHATLAAHAFRELNEHPPLLVERRVERASLGDFEQRSYWLEIKSKRTVALEVAARHLADLRLWRDGTWLVDVAPQISQSQAHPEQPLAVARLTAELPPGLYLLTAYGGRGQPWTESSDAKPFLLRFGIPTLGPAERQQFTMSEFGVERFVVPSGPSHFRLELPSADAATLQVGSYSAQAPFATQGQSASIDKKSLPPVAELRQEEDHERIVTVTMAAGKPFVLQHFAANTEYHFNGSGNYWVSSIHAGYADDSIGASAVLTRQPRNGPEEYLAEQAIELDQSTFWHRRFNLLDDLTLIVKVPSPETIRVVGEGVAARFRFEPFLTSRPRDYKTPPWQPSGYSFELDRGMYVLSVTPDTRGILDLHLLPHDGKPTAELSTVSAAVRFPSLQLDNGSSYTLYLNRQPGVASGVVLRRLPIDLSHALPVTRRPGETLAIPVSVPERGTLRALTEDGKTLELSLDNGKKGFAIEVEAGQYTVTIAGATSTQAQQSALSLSLGFEPQRLASSTPLPPLPDTRLSALPRFPAIMPDAPRFLTLKRRSAETYNVRVSKAGLYRFETTGLLHTGGKVRTRINPSLFEENENGVGSNFLIQRYLREGDYQLTLSTRGETQGDLGVQLARSDVVDGGDLREGEVARALLPSGQVLAYRFRIAKRGNYHLQALGLGRNFDLRLEDDQGWPIAAPVQTGDLTQELEAGSYRVLVLPQTTEARVLMRIDRVAEARHYKGHGPHRVDLESTVAHTWQEPAKGEARQPDVWAFALPAPAQITLALDSEMEATLVSTDAPGEVVARIAAKAPVWRGDLKAGRYQLRAQHSRNNNYVSYTVHVGATQLLASQSRLVVAPVSIPISVGSDGLIELQSFGPADVRARLVDAAGETIAQNDDRPGDWNFQIARRLRPGEYRLLVDPVGQRQAQTTVSMHAPGEVVEKSLALGTDVTIRDAQVHVYPLAVPANQNVLLVSASSRDAVGLALEGETAQGWTSLGTQIGKAPYLALPISTERFKSYRLRAWSADRRSLNLSLRAIAANLTPQAESQLLQGNLAAIRVDEKRPTLKMALIALARPGVFRLKGDLAQLQWSDSGLRTTQADGNPVISVSGKTLWLVSDESAHKEAASVLAAERLRLPVDEQESLRLELMAGQVGSVDLHPHGEGPSLVLAEGRAAQPGVALNEARDSATMGFVPGAAVTFVPAGVTGPVRVWNATSNMAPLELDLRQFPLRQGGSLPLGFGVSDGVIKARFALPLKLSGELTQVRLSLSPMNAAVFIKHGSVLSTHWAGDDTMQETVATHADQLLLINASAGEARYSIEVMPGSVETEQALKPGELLERNVSTAGRLHVPIELPKSEGDGYRLRVRGDTQAIWQENGGRIESGTDIVLRGSGVLWLQHQPGTLLAWLDEPRAQSQERLERWFKSLQETVVKPPQSVTLKGKQQVLSFNLDQAEMLHLRTSVPVVTQFLIQGQPAQTEAHLHGANINLLAPTGVSRLLLRAVGTDNLSGNAAVMETPATPLADGRGPEVLLAPGSARLFSFDLKHPATLGIGVRASSDVVRSVLYDAHGEVLAQGVVQMPTLTPGRYYLSIEIPADCPPVRVQPIVIGLTPPDTRPPSDILRQYVTAKEGAEALIYVPPPPAPPPGNTAVQTDEQAVEGEAGEGDSEGAGAGEPGQNPEEETQ